MRRVAALTRLCTTLLAAAVMLVAAAPVDADVFEPISLASATPIEQANSAADPVVSGNGRYVAFDGSVAGVSGVWRRDLLSGAIQGVAVAHDGDPALDAADARLPSISADGRFVSFTTTAALDPSDDANAAPDVYVRDMDVAEPAPGAFVLASAADGSAQGLSYDFGEQQSFGRGSLASGRSALSADGRKVAFVTTAVSNLADPAITDTPPLQVAVRDLDTMRTLLVSAEYDASTGQMSSNPVPLGSEGGPSYGAVYPGGAQVPRFPNPFEGASISADGSTVVWMGQSIAKQAAVLNTDPAVDVGYAEPLLRRIGAGVQALTRRVTGGSDPLSPRCTSGEDQLMQPPTLLDGCQGPFEPVQEGGALGILTVPNVDQLPRLSADGRTVAFLASAREIASGEEFGAAAKASDDLYVADMHDGLSRVQSLRRLTEIASSNISDPGRVAPIVDFGVSADGSQVAFATQRTTFPLGSPAYVSAPAATAVAQELFDADLDNDTLTRVTQSYDGGVSEPVNAVVGSPSFSADGNTLSFSSTASNLVYGDGNGASDAFVVRRKQFAEMPAPQLISPPPSNPTVAPDWRLFARARSRTDGSVMLELDVPGAGHISAGAYGVVRVRSRAARGRSAHDHSARAGTHVATRRLASSAKTIAASTEIATLRLVAARPYRPLVSRRGGLSATVNVAFVSAGRRTLRATVPVTFSSKARATTKRHARARRAGSAAAAGAGR